MTKLLLFVVCSVLLIQYSIQRGTHTFSTCFTSDPASNDMFDVVDNIVLSSAKDGFQSTYEIRSKNYFDSVLTASLYRIDPNSIPSHLKGVVSYWPMDSVDGTGYTTDASRAGNVPGKVVNASVVTGKFKNGLSVATTGYMFLLHGS